MTEQIAILGNETSGTGPGVVGAEDGGQVRTPCEQLHNTTNGIGGDDHVSVDEEEDVALCMAGSVIPRRSGPRVLGELQNWHSHLCRGRRVSSADASSTAMTSEPGKDEAIRAERRSCRSCGLLYTGMIIDEHKELQSRHGASADSGVV